MQDACAGQATALHLLCCTGLHALREAIPLCSALGCTALHCTGPQVAFWRTRASEQEAYLLQYSPLKPRIVGARCMQHAARQGGQERPLRRSLGNQAGAGAAGA